MRRSILPGHFNLPFTTPEQAAPLFRTSRCSPA
nr:MAG TPA: hypothetical protein [Caudoviricetes sp.]